MVNISTDGKTVATGDDFARLVQQYNNVSFIESPDTGGAGSTSYPTCAAPTANFLASNTLPPTPNSNLCDCVERTFSCLFTPQTPNYTAILGELLNYGCSQLGQNGGTCDAIGADGGAGKYGSLSGCDPSTYIVICISPGNLLTMHPVVAAIKLSYVMSSLYEATNRNPVTVRKMILLSSKPSVSNGFLLSVILMGTPP